MNTANTDIEMLSTIICMILVVFINSVVVKEFWPKEIDTPIDMGQRWALVTYFITSIFPLTKFMSSFYLGDMSGAMNSAASLVIGSGFWALVAFGLGYLWNKLSLDKRSISAASSLNNSVKKHVIDFESKIWWYAEENEKKGPVSRNELKDLYTQNLIIPQTLVWKEGMDEWESISDISSLSDIIRSCPPSLPNAPPDLP